MAEELNEDKAKEAGMSAEEMRARLVGLVFGGDEGRLQEFCAIVQAALPPGTGAVMRGSSITGVRHSDGAPFDADGPGTSDLDLTLLGEKIHDCYILDGYYIPGIHTKPLSDKDPDIAPDLVPLREELMQMVGRPVNIQATRDFVMYLRGDIIGQAYLTLIERGEET